MSGGSIPYHLRQNKAVDRNLFLDLLSRINRCFNISDYTYIGFGGPFMEDFKAVHGALRIRSMISIEGDANVWHRQGFNMPASCIDARNIFSGDFLLGHDFHVPTIIWLDYTMPSALPEQLAETRQLLSKLNAGDIFRITLNANPASLGTPDLKANPPVDIHDFRLAEMIRRLGVYAPSICAPENTYKTNYPRVLAKSLESAVKKGLSASTDLVALPLTEFVYEDGQQMLTVTGIVLKRDFVARFLELTRLEAWPFTSTGWGTPRSISVPELSVKERLAVEESLPDATGEAIVSDVLKYYIGESRQEAAQLMDNFVAYYRHFPWYTRVVL